MVLAAGGLLLAILMMVYTFAPVLVAMLIAYRMTRRGEPRRLLAGGLATAAGFTLYLCFASTIRFYSWDEAMGPPGLILGFGYALAGALGGLAIARRLYFEEPAPRRFADEP